MGACGNTCAMNSATWRPYRKTANLLCLRQPTILPPFVSLKRDAGLIAIEQSVRLAIRDSVNRTSRKPFTWGGLAGYDQLYAISQALHGLPIDTETSYLRQLIPQVDRALEVNQGLADDVRAAHQWLCRIADCLHYPADQAQA